MTDNNTMTKANGAGVAPSSKTLEARKTNPNFQRILKAKRFLKGEERDQYERDLEALVEEFNPQSFLSWKDIEDYADKLQGERRYKPAIAAVMDAKLAPRKHQKIDPEREKREANAVEEYLPTVMKLTRLVDNSFDTRKRLEKDFRRQARASLEDAAPSIVPETRIDE